ncbi:DUF4111 domain-containing protein [Rathayibacter festucae]|uniref:DUF4111 domain-containing protein n=1 Tax=Rathayibacter festucae TaxID=110937 RepID=A0ABX6GZ84_9MICO|nr:aminoglycoside adenylyltransferase domain-containing protein [Rathayibacter festucae]QHC62720.1 DUF4111 domain-containing protein [Rathayibacter festucae]
MVQGANLLMRLADQVDTDSATELVGVLDELRDAALEILGPALVGVYLTGSFALNRGDEASDVDFLVVADRALSQDDEEQIRRVHAAFPLRAERWAQHLEGSWVGAEALRDSVGAHEPWLYVDNGSDEMNPSRHDDTWNSRWVLREAGVPLAGPSPIELLPAVEAGLIKAEAVEQAAAKAAWIQEQPQALSNGWAQPYVVLTFCRLLWSATFGTVTSKGDAAAWVIREIAPERFRDLIQSAAVYRLHAFDPANDKADPSYVQLAGDFVAWATVETTRRGTAQSC